MPGRKQKQHDYGGWIAEAEQHWIAFRKLNPIYVDGERAIMSLATFDKLDDYSCSLPSAAIIGKLWCRREPYVQNEQNVFWLGEYAAHPDDKTLVRIRWYKIYLKLDTEEPRRASSWLISRIRNAAKTVEALKENQ